MAPSVLRWVKRAPKDIEQGLAWGRQEGSASYRLGEPRGFLAGTVAGARAHRSHGALILLGEWLNFAPWPPVGIKENHAIETNRLFMQNVLREGVSHLPDPPCIRQELEGRLSARQLCVKKKKKKKREERKKKV